MNSVISEQEAFEVSIYSYFKWLGQFSASVSSTSNANADAKDASKASNEKEGALTSSKNQKVLEALKDTWPWLSEEHPLLRQHDALYACNKSGYIPDLRIRFGLCPKLKDRIRTLVSLSLSSSTSGSSSKRKDPPPSSSKSTDQHQAQQPSPKKARASTNTIGSVEQESQVMAAGVKESRNARLPLSAPPANTKPSKLSAPDKHKKLLVELRKAQQKQQAADTKKIQRLRAQVEKLEASKTPPPVVVVPLATPYVPRPPPKRWEESYQELVHFQRVNGHTRVTKSMNKSMGGWIQAQRSAKLQDKMSPAKIELLHKIGFEWRVRTLGMAQTPWNVRYEELQQYQGLHGHCNVPRTSYKANPQLGEWVHTQRRLYSKSPTYLQTDRPGRLEALGLEWTIRAYTPKRFGERVEELIEFRRLHGHLKVPGVEYAVPKGKKQTDQNLEEEEELKDVQEGREGANQANNHNHNKEAKGRVSNHNNHDEAQGRVSANINYEVDGRSLSSWVDWVRKEYSNGWRQGKLCKLDKQKVQQLERIGFDWEYELGKGKSRQSWRHQVAAIHEFMTRNGHCRVPMKENPKLLAWVKATRQQYQKWNKGEKTTFNEDRHHDLKTIGFVFESWRGSKLPKGDATPSKEKGDASHSENDDDDDSGNI
jgi:hypothetical protein